LSHGGRTELEFDFRSPQTNRGICRRSNESGSIVQRGDRQDGRTVSIEALHDALGGLLRNFVDGVSISYACCQVLVTQFYKLMHVVDVDMVGVDVGLVEVELVQSGESHR